MVESVGTTTTFNMPVDEIIDLALKAVLGEHTSHEESRNARTALNLVLIDLQNRDMAPLSSMEEVSVDLVSGSALDYTLNSKYISLLQEGVIRVSSSGSSSDPVDLPIRRIAYDEWLRIPTKESQGRPTHFHVDRQRDGIEINFWPKPDSNQYTFRAWGLSRIGDVTRSHQLLDIPHIYLPAIVLGLKYYMATLRPKNVALEERLQMQRDYETTLQRALDQDRERVDFDIYPTNRPQLN